MASRSVKEGDFSVILETMQLAVDDLKLTSLKPTAKAMDARKATVHLVYNNEHSYIVDECFLVCYQIGTPWFSEDLVLGEMTVLRLASGGSFTAVADFLKAEASRHSCKWVLVGTLLSNCDELLSRLYRRYGFSKSLVQLAMEV